jgi:signal transduction histidine kinase
VFRGRRNRARRWRDPRVRGEALEELIRAATAAPDAASLRAAVTSRFVALADCRAAWFMEPDRKAGTLVATWCDQEGSPDQLSPAFPLDGPLATWLRINGAPLVFPGRTGIDAYLHEDERRQLEANGVGACIPVFTVGRLRAVILLASARRRWELQPDLGDFLMMCGHHAGLAYATIERHEAAVEEVRTAAHTQRLAVAGQFAAMVAHEVRNPLAIIRGAVQLVRDTDEGLARRHDLLGDAMAEIDRISETVEGFLSLSRPALVHEEVVDLVALVSDAVRVVETYATSRDIAITTAYAFRSLRVLGDPRELRQVFLNILLNASQAMQGAGTITIRTDLVEELRGDGSGHRTMAVVSVTDTGPGVPDDLIGRIFEPFVSTKASGTGLGLAICGQIAERHGGRITVESNEGRGTTFAVYLPLRTGE